jgi:CO dehydrogenase/acetyl-CoA synthase alpha subunit
MRAATSAETGENMTTPANRPPCICGCGEVPTSKKSRYVPGHDAKLAHKVAEFLDEHGIADVDELLRQAGRTSVPKPSPG